MAGVGDTDADGVPDFAVEGYFSRLFVLSGATGTRRFQVKNYFHSVSGGLDANLDGYDDLVVGDLVPGQPGETLVLSGADGSMLFRMLGERVWDEFGESVDFVGDVNADGFPEFIAGAPNANGYFRLVSMNPVDWQRIGGDWLLFVPAAQKTEGRELLLQHELL